MTNTPEKGGTPAQPTEVANGLDASPTPVSDVVGETIRRRYAGSPGLIDLGVSRRLMSRLLGFGQRRVPLLNRVLARSALGAGEGSLSPLTLFWGSPLWWPHQPEGPAMSEPAVPRGQSGPSGDPYPSMLLPSAPSGRPAPQLKRENLEISASKPVTGSADTPLAMRAPVVVKPRSSSGISTPARKSGTEVQPLRPDRGQVPATPILRPQPELASSGSSGPSQTANVLSPAHDEVRAAPMNPRPEPALSGGGGPSQAANLLSPAHGAIPLFRSSLPGSGLPVRPGPRGLHRLSERIWRASKLGLSHRRTELFRSRLDPGSADYITSAPNAVLALVRATRVAPEIAHAPGAEGSRGLHQVTPGVVHQEPASPPPITRTQTREKSILSSGFGPRAGNPSAEAAPGASRLPSSASPGDIYRFAHVESPQRRPGSVPAPPTGQKNVRTSAAQESTQKPAPQELSPSASATGPSSFQSSGDSGDSTEIGRSKSEPLTNTQPPQPASRPDPTTAPVTNRGDAESSGALTTHAGVSESSAPVARVVQAFIPQGAMQIAASVQGWSPFPLFHRLAGISRWPGRTAANAASGEPGVDRFGAAATLGGTTLPRIGPAPGVPPSTTSSRNSWLGHTHGSIPFPVLRNRAGSSAPVSLHESPLSHAAPVRQTISRAQIQPSTGTLPSQIRPDHSTVRSLTESSSVEPSSAGAVQRVSFRPGADLSPNLCASGLEIQTSPREPAPPWRRPLSGRSRLFTALSSRAARVLRRWPPGAPGRPGFAGAPPFAPMILLSVNAPTTVSRVQSAGRAIGTGGRSISSDIQSLRESPGPAADPLPRTLHDYHDHPVARAAVPGAEHSPKSEAGWIGSVSSASALPFLRAARAALLSRQSFAQPLPTTHSLPAAPGGGIGGGFASNQNPFDLPVRHGPGSAGAPSGQAPRTGGEPRPVLSFSDLPGATTRDPKDFRLHGSEDRCRTVTRRSCRERLHTRSDRTSSSASPHPMPAAEKNRCLFPFTEQPKLQVIPVPSWRAPERL